jgi:hypothetical protein
MIVSVIVSLAAFFFLVVLLRRDGWHGSLGIPISYLALLLFWHVPGGLATVLAVNYSFGDVAACDTGMRLTAIGCVCFVAGVWLARRKKLKFEQHRLVASVGTSSPFWKFCLLVGLGLVVVVGPMHNIPTVGAVVRGGGGVWMLGVMLGIRAGFRQGSLWQILSWASLLVLYISFMLVHGGFLCFGFTAAVFCLSTLVVSTRGLWRVILGIVVASVLGLSVFVSYFVNRDELRAAVWGGQTMELRVAAVQKMVKDVKWMDFSDNRQVQAIDERLNQNLFVGMAAQNIEEGTAHFLYGKSVWDGMVALVPRVIWPGKPVYAGSARIVADFTGLPLEESASWAVGNVMEFYVNGGILGVVLGFLGLGWFLGRLDFLGSKAESNGDTSVLLTCFLILVPLVNQNSFAQMTGEIAAATIAAFAWSWCWKKWKGRSSETSRKMEVWKHSQKATIAS